MRSKQLGNRILFVLSLISIMFVISACSPYHPTPHDALTEFPGYLTKENLASLTVLQQETVADGLVLLYRYQPDMEVGEYCLATTFVTEEKNGSWRAQSASKLECGNNLSGRFKAIFTVGGNITELTTAYGLSNDGSHVRIQWSDGIVSVVPLINNVFLKSRPANLQVDRIDLLDADDTVLEKISWTN